MSGNGLGNETQSGILYQKSFAGLTNSFSYVNFMNAVNNFKTGSNNNASGLYNRYPRQKNNQTKSILQLYYPKKQ